ncbi:hypothetical protein, partial [Rhizobium laguerreae]|uniref:hypothetical protein n=1 Tax=Rhizobium laguerreae TaxID=1076926 RepID=UPI001C8FB557
PPVMNRTNSRPYRARAGSADDRWYFMAVVPMMDMQGVANAADMLAARFDTMCLSMECWV